MVYTVIKTITYNNQKYLEGELVKIESELEAAQFGDSIKKFIKHTKSKVRKWVI